jgi:hypothetical protein
VVDHVTIRPDAARWPGLVRAAFAARDRSMAEANRRALGLPTDRPVVMSGHQARVWHPGILAKWMASVAAAGAVGEGAAAAWVVVDQDEGDPFEVVFPARLPGGRLARRSWPGRDPLAGAPAALRPAATDLPAPGVEAPESVALDCVAAGLARVRGAMAARAGEPSAARQVARAAADLAGPVSPRGAAPVLVYASDLCRAPLLADLVARMRRDADGCAGAYNRAVAESPGSGVSMLATDDARRGAELPLWRLRPAAGALPARRERVYADTIGSTPLEQLAPRALLMTAVLRLACCDLFIHGTGGGGEDGGGGGAPAGYDAVMERWIAGWLGDGAGGRGAERGPRLAPAAVVTATLRLPFGIEPATAEQAARAAWLAHRARHDPALLGDGEAARAKRALVERIAAARRRGEHPRDLFLHLHDLLRQSRERHAERLARLEAEAGAVRARLRDAAIINDRTWPFPLYPGDDLAALRDRIEQSFAGAAGS